jgi:DNA-binding MarR family transcriptional regulator
MTERALDKTAADFLWQIFKIHSRLEVLNESWADLIGVTAAQWLILMAVSELQEGSGVSGDAIAKKLCVQSGFVTSQTKNLEKAGFLLRTPSAVDTRVVLMSMTERALAEFDKLSKRRLSLNSTIFNGLDEKTLADLNVALAIVAKNAQLAAKLLAIDVAFGLRERFVRPDDD